MSERRCPFCERRGARADLHLHMVEAHAERVETWTDARRGRMRYRVECPVCGEAYEHSVKPRSRDRAFLETFAREIRMVAFDMVLSHLEAEHEDDGAESDENTHVDEGPGQSLPDFGPGGGTGRPGHGGLPLPPGMDLPPAPGIPGHPRPGRERKEEGPGATVSELGGTATWRR